VSDDNKLRAVDESDRPEGPTDEEKGRELAERMVKSVGRFLWWMIKTFVMAFPLALVCWWMYAVLLPPTLLGDLGYWQWYAVLVLVRVIWGNDRQR
jgi:hypothetical protein